MRRIEQAIERIDNIRRLARLDAERGIFRASTGSRSLAGLSHGERVAYMEAHDARSYEIGNKVNERLLVA
jgi:hypothetical protein